MVNNTNGESKVDKFFSLPNDKKLVIINAGLSVFSRNGYRKCSVNDIASMADISKSMVFYYFGTKKEMYFYLIEHIGNTIIEQLKNSAIDRESDFFDRIREATDIKVSILMKHPNALSFLKRFYFETDKEVVDDIKAWLSKGFSFSSDFALKDIDKKKFKAEVDPNLIIKFLHTYSEGFIGKFQNQLDLNIDDMISEFYQFLDILKQNLYKEEYR